MMLNLESWLTVYSQRSSTKGYALVKRDVFPKWNMTFIMICVLPCVVYVWSAQGVVGLFPCLTSRPCLVGVGKGSTSIYLSAHQSGRKREDLFLILTCRHWEFLYIRRTWEMFPFVLMHPNHIEHGACSRNQIYWVRVIGMWLKSGVKLLYCTS